MRGLTSLSVLFAFGAVSAAAAQIAPYPSPYRPYPGGAAAAIADQHRYETERLRLQAQDSAALAGRLQAEADRRRQALEADRAAAAYPAAPFAPPVYGPARAQPLEQTRRPQDARPVDTPSGAGRGVDQIDDWLARRP